MHDTLREAMMQMGMGKTPVRSKKDLVVFLKKSKGVQYHENCRPIKEDWKRWMNGVWWGTGYTGELEPRAVPMLKLRDTLLAIGGEEACLPIQDPDLDHLMEYGQIWVGQKKVRMKRGEASRCHQNSAYLWQANRYYNAGIFGVATGYAMSDDGVWRQHSWCVLKKPRSYQIVETTTPRELYFGVCMLGSDAERFCESVCM